MKKLLVVTALLLPTLAFAQVEPAEYVLRVTPGELGDISTGLQELPFKKAVPIINKLRQQVMEQQKPVAPVEPKVEEGK